MVGKPFKRRTIFTVIAALFLSVTAAALFMWLRPTLSGPQSATHAMSYDIPSESENGRNAGTTAPSEGESQGMWKQDQLVELTGRIYPARTEARYFIATSDFGAISVRSDAIDKLDVGTLIWIRGKVEYVHYPKPKDHYNDKGGVNYGVGFPQTICYINVSEHRVISPEQAIPSN